VPPGPHRLGFDGFWAGYNFWHNYRRAFYYGDDGRRVAVEGYEPDGQTELALRWLESGRDPRVPFALFLSYGTPHDPWTEANVPAEYLEPFRDIPFPPPLTYADGSAEYWNPRKDRQWWLATVVPNLASWQRIYAAMTANLDWNLGRLLRGLDRLDLSEDTLLVFTSDHGEMFGAHGRIAKNIFYEEAVRVPFLVRWPGRVPAGAAADALLNTPDIMPTLLSLLGLPVPPGAEGMDLSRAVRGLPGPEPAEALLQGMGATFLWEDGYEWRAVRDRCFTYAIARADGREYLFDLHADPLQALNRAGDAALAGVLARYRAILRRRLAALGDAFEACTWYRDHWTSDRVIVRSATLHAPG
jgi:arylsulfatase A-like enzyme